MKKLVSLLISLCIVFCFASLSFGAEFDQQLWTDTYLVLDMTTGEVLTESNMNERMYPASLTKMMTAVLAYEYFEKQPNGFQTMVYADEEAVDVEPTRFGIKNNEAMTADEALNIMLVMSANDIAVMLAKEVGGNVENFARLMNLKAEELGMNDTHFVTPNGLHDDDHYSTAADLAKLALYLLDNEYLASIVAQKSYSYAPTNRHEGGEVLSTNLLYSDKVSVYVGNRLTTTEYTRGKVFGVKTGTTPEAGGCLIAAVQKDMTKVLVVILNSRDGEDSYQIERFSDAHKLLDWTFDNFATRTVFSAGDSYGSIKVRRGEFNKVETVLSEDVSATVPLSSSEGYISYEYTLDDSIKAPFEEGSPVGKLTVYAHGELLGEYDIVTARAVAKGGILSVFGVEDETAHRIFRGVGKVLLVVFILFLLLMGVRIYNKRRAKKRKAERARKKAALEARRRAEWGDRYDEMMAAEKAKKEQPETLYYYEKDDRG